MAVGKCDSCGVDEYMPFVCKFCRGRYCASHRLPENHGCQGLATYKERSRSEGRWMAPEPGVMSPKMSGGARMGASFGRLVDRIDGKATTVLLVTMGIVYVLQLVVHAVSFEAHRAIFTIGRDFYLTPWTLVTNLLSHGSVMHLFLNAIGLFFFGSSLERLIGTRRFLALFFAGGVLAAVGHVAVFNYLIPMFAGPDLAYLAHARLLGASGAVMAIVGTMTFLAPKLPVLIFFVVPAPLWVLSFLFVIVNVAGLFDVASEIANLAHLVGLAAGLLYGRRLHAQGLRVRMGQPQQPMMRRNY